MKIIITINNCRDCRHLSHTGAFTKGGAKPCCDHNSRVGRAKSDDCFKRVIKDINKIPSDCPLKFGKSY